MKIGGMLNWSILLILNFERNFFVSRFEVKQNLKQVKIFLADFGNIIHFFAVFEVILAFKRARGTPFFFAFRTRFGQISESTKKIKSGFHNLKNFSIKNPTSRGKNL